MTHIHRRHLGVLAALIILSLGLGACSEDNPVTPGDDHSDAEGLVLVLNGQDILTVADATVQGGLSVKNGTRSGTITVYFLDHDGERFTPDAEKSLEFSVANGDVLEIEREAGPWTFQLKGKSTGQTTMEIRLMHAGHPDFRTPPIPVTVTAQ